MRSSRKDCVGIFAATIGLALICGCSSLKITLEIDPDFPSVLIEDEDSDADLHDSGRES